MHVGKGMFVQNLDGHPEKDIEIVAHELALADQAEPAGFESVWIAEHHFSGYHMAPNVAQYLTYMAARTKSVRLGSMVVVLPWHEPLRVAEELSVLDHMSRGRLLVGLGRGLGRIEFEGFRIEMGESRDRFSEYAEALVEAFDSGKMAYDGTYYKQPPVGIRPIPPSPLRGRVYASAVSPASMELMARLGFGVMVIAQKPWETTEREIAAYRDRFLELNGQLPPRPLLVQFVNVHESEQAAREMHEQYTVRYGQSCVDHYEFGNEGLATIPGYEYYGALAGRIAKHGEEKYARFLADLQVSGTPDQVIEAITENVRRIDAAGVITVLSFADMPPEVSQANQSLFIEKVLPQLKATDPNRFIESAPAPWTTQ